MRMQRVSRAQAGLSLVEVIFVSALIMLVFGGLLAGMRYSLELIAQSRAQLSALSLANDRMELFRSLPYDDVGTVSGIPSGTIPQTSTTMLNGIEFTERVLVEFIDDPADGQLTATTTDSNGIPSDYKRIKIELTWEIYERPGSLSLVSNIVPRSIETTAGGGTARINVIDQDSLPLPGAEVRLFNDALSPAIDITRFSDISGAALFSGAPAGSEYEVVVTAPGYSTDQTYRATTSNPNPITAPFTVLESDISTLTFQIGELSDLDIAGYTNVNYASTTANFADWSEVAASSSVALNGGELELDNTLGVYDSSGTVYLATTSPTTLDQWGAITMARTIPTDTTLTLQLFTASSSGYQLIPDSELPGNGAGFTSQIIPLDALDAVLYPEVIVGVTLATSDTSVTPSLDQVQVIYRSSATPASGYTLAVRGNKTIGTETDSSPIYKFSDTVTLNGVGEHSFSDMEFDTYTITPSGGADVAHACPGLPVSLQAGEDTNLELVFTADTLNSLRISVIDDLGESVPGASISLDSDDSGVSEVRQTTPCGTAFFGGIPADTDYVIEVEKPGYDSVTIDPFALSDDSSTLIILNQS